MMDLVLFNWKIDAIERKAEQAVSRLYEIDSLRSDVGRLEHSLRETRSDVDVLRAQLSSAQDSIIQLLRWQEEQLIAEAKQPKGDA